MGRWTAIIQHLLMICFDRLAGTDAGCGRRLSADLRRCRGGNGRILRTGVIQKNEHQSRPPASIIKVLTGISALENIPVDPEVIISWHAAQVGEASVHLRPGENWAIGELVHGALIAFGNDAAYAIAEYVGG